MRNTHSFLSLAIAELAMVTGGCKKGPPPQQLAQAAPDGGVDVSVATGAQGGQLIQQALQQG
jgi:hypothetical protein